MTLLKDKESLVERDGRSAIYSHQKSFSNFVSTICHHSGRYLTEGETNPSFLFIWREQHDFPGLPKLDRFFQKAAHSKQHEHWIWSLAGIQGTAFLISGAIILYLVQRAYQLEPFIYGGLWFYIISALLIIGIIGGTMLIAYALYLIDQRHPIFHKKFAGSPPAIRDFPIECTYEIEVEETLKAELGNVCTFPENVQYFNGRITTTLNPLQNELETFAEYQKQYRRHLVGEFVTAGTIGIEGLDGIEFEEKNVDFDHRLLLRAPAANLKLNTDTGTYAPVTVKTSYQVKPDPIFPLKRGQQQFPLQCEPRVSHDDSRMLELHFSWLGPQPAPKIVLEKCILHDIPQTLKPVTTVLHGRFDPALDEDEDQVVWRGLTFQSDQHGVPRLFLAVSFEHPLLDCLEQIKGTFEVKLNSLVSHLDISDQHIWTAWGRKAKPDDSLIRKKAGVSGDLNINPQLLSQEHEHVTNVQPLLCSVPPNDKTVKKIMNVLLDEGFDLHRISQAPSRLHPTGRLDARLGYWDISGRHYDRETLEAIDVHVVISGYRHISRVSTKESISAQTKIDIRLRCLHDPRNPLTANHADTLIGGYADKSENGRSPADQPLLPHRLYGRFKNVLLNSGSFTHSREMRALFADNRIAQWQNELPELDVPAERVEAIIENLVQVENNNGENGLHLLLEVMKSRTDEENMEYKHLTDLVQQLNDFHKASSNIGKKHRSSKHKRPLPEMSGLVNRIQQALACEDAEK